MLVWRHFHGPKGAANRDAVQQGATELLEQHGFKKGETAYTEKNHFNL